MEKEYVYRWNVTYRIHHWVLVLTITVLTFTGFYIHWPFLPGGSPGGIGVMAWMRFAHFVAAYILILSVVARVYLAFCSTFYADWKDFGIWQNLRNAPDILGYYLFVKRTHKEPRRYNPLQALTYFFWVFLILFLALTGFGLYQGKLFGLLSAPNSFRWVNAALGGESYTRIWHYLGMWVFIVTSAIHVYMGAITTWSERDHTLRSILTGYKVNIRRA